MSWTEENIGLLKKLWNDGRSASQIACNLGPWCTRNAVISKIHRLGLTERVKQSANPAARSKKFASTETPSGNADAWREAQIAPKKNIGRQLPLSAGEINRGKKSEPMHVAEASAPPESKFVTLLDLDNHSCRWPLGDTTNFETLRYCGAPHADMSAGRPYCPHHARIAKGAWTLSGGAASKVRG